MIRLPLCLLLFSAFVGIDVVLGPVVGVTNLLYEALVFIAACAYAESRGRLPWIAVFLFALVAAIQPSPLYIDEGQGWVFHQPDLKLGFLFEYLRNRFILAAVLLTALRYVLRLPNPSRRAA
jgi:hypothetical protein